MKNITTKNISLEEMFEIHKQIPEFIEESPNISYFTRKLEDKEYICLWGYIDNTPAGYIVAYDKYHDESLYCWMAGVIPDFRKVWILSRMMKNLEKQAQKLWYSKISIKTRNTRREMLTFLVKNNFLFQSIHEYDTPEENRISLFKNI